MPTDDLSLALRDGATIEDENRPVTLRHHVLGELVAPTGKIVACDPFVFPETEPFIVEVAPGRYPLVVSVAELVGGDQRVAYAVLRVGADEPVRWEMATLPGQDISTLPEHHIFGYPVDAGTGCLMDAAAARALQARMEASNDYAEDVLFPAMDEHYIHTWGWADVAVDEASGANMIYYSSGFGDGFYASYWGYNTDGAPVCLVTDFAVIG